MFSFMKRRALHEESEHRCLIFALKLTCCMISDKLFCQEDQMVHKHSSILGSYVSQQSSLLPLNSLINQGMWHARVLLAS